MTRYIVLLLMLSVCASLLPCDGHALGVSAKLGAGFIPNGSVPGAMAALELGPISPFAEFFRKSGLTTTNLGANLILKLPLPMVQPYGGIGGGMSWASGNAIATKSSRMIDLMAGVNVILPSKVGLFGQIKYIYTFGSGPLAGAWSARVRDVALQAGLMLRLGK